MVKMAPGALWCLQSGEAFMTINFVFEFSGPNLIFVKVYRRDRHRATQTRDATTHQSRSARGSLRE